MKYTFTLFEIGSNGLFLRSFFGAHILFAHLGSRYPLLTVSCDGPNCDAIGVLCGVKILLTILHFDVVIALHSCSIHFRMFVALFSSSVTKSANVVKD